MARIVVPAYPCWTNIRRAASRILRRVSARSRSRRSKLGLDRAFITVLDIITALCFVKRRRTTHLFGRCRSARPRPILRTTWAGADARPLTEATLSTVLQSLSTELADAVQSAGRAVVAIHARRRIPASGVHWRPGVVVSTNHTISRDENITATLPDGTTAAATLAGRDPGTDLAVLKLAGQKVATASLRLDPPPKVGELGIALGRPGPSLTAGWGVVTHVAGPWRTWQGAEIDSLLRLDLAIYDGFSGGPLIDGAGRVLGINTSALARGLPVTIPVATVERIVTELLEHGTIRRAYLGIGTQQVRVPESLARKLELKGDVALLVVSLEPGGPADRDGLLLGDVLLELGGAAVSDAADVLAKLGGEGVGKPLAARVVRGGQGEMLQLPPGERPVSRAA